MLTAECPKESAHEKTWFRSFLHAAYVRYGCCSGPASQPASQGGMQIVGRKIHHRGLLQPAHEGPQDFRRPSSDWTSLAHWSERSDNLRDHVSLNGGRQR